MGRSKHVKRARERFCTENRQTNEVASYVARQHGESTVSTLAPAVLSILDINEGDQLDQFVDTEAEVIIIVPRREGE